MNLDAPLILLGCGGGGTRLLTKLVDCEQVFLGNVLNRTGDSLEWKEIGHEFAARALEEPRAPDAALRLRAHADAVLNARPGGLETVWGWKLPETMLFLPWALEAFPAARVVLLMRHPVSVALSRRHITAAPDHWVGGPVLRAAYGALGGSLRTARAAPQYERSAISWAFQMERALGALAEPARAGRVHGLYYEAVCADPEAAMEAIDRFAGLAPAPRPAPAIDSARLRRFDPADPVARSIWNLAGGTASKIGYAAGSAGPIASWPPAGPSARSSSHTLDHQ